MVFAVRKNGISVGAYYEDAATLFSRHIVWVLTKYPLQSLLRRSDFTGRIAKWGTRLRTFNIWYKLRNSIKGQVLADFVAEFNVEAECSNSV